jgi:methylmalonyl-CoA/ethylmalonyl-CoA epimerase
MSTDSDLEIDHLGVEVGALEPAIRAICKLFGYHQATEPVVNTRHRVEVVFLEKAGSLPIKLIRPIDRPAAPTAKLHHVAFRTGDLEQTLAALKAEGGRVLSPPQPGEAFDDEPIAFVFAAGLNVELVATTKRRNRIAPPEGPAQDADADEQPAAKNATSEAAC